MYQLAKFTFTRSRKAKVGPASVLLLHGDGADGSTTIIDSSASAHTMTAGGNAQIDTAQSKFGGASILFDGTGDYITGDGSADFTFGTGDFTIDMWVRPNSVSGFPYIIALGNSANLVIYISGSKFVFHAVGGDRIIATTTLSTATWYHVAVTRSAGNSRLFVNGTQEGSTFSDSHDYDNTSNRPVIGINPNLSTLPFDGWIDELRILKGLAAWTANFTPATSAYSG